jgi:dephospho-CoA kinase
MSRQLLLGLTGLSGSGKTSNAEWLGAERGFTLFEGSISIAREAARAGVALDSREAYETFYRIQQGLKGAD